LGLSAHPDVIKAGQGLLLTPMCYECRPVRFILAVPRDIHKELERKTAPSFWVWKIVFYMQPAFDANGGTLWAILGAEDAIISDALNHASS